MKAHQFKIFINSIEFRKYFTSLVFVIGTSIFFIRNLILVTNGGHPWGYGEWLINYGGGVVRRGFFGEIFLHLTPNSKYSIIILAIIQFLIYFYIWFFAFTIIKENDFSWFAIAFILNPSGFLFNCWDLNVLSRKESLGLISLILLGKAYKKRYQLHISNRYLIFGLLVYNFSLLSSEVNLFFIFGILFLIFKIHNKYFKITLISQFSLMSLLTVFTYLKHGNALTSKLICQKIVDNGLSPINCGGATDAISLSLKDAVLHLIGDYPANLIYFFLLFIGLIPIITRKWNQLNNSVIMFFIISKIPLYAIAWDYGRWNYMIICEVTLIFYFLNDQLTPISDSSIKNKSKFKWSAETCIPYVLLWGVWHGGNPISNGLVGPLFSTLRLIKNLLY